MPWSQKDADLAQRILKPEYLTQEFLGYMNDYNAMNMAPIPASNIMGLNAAMIPIGVPLMWLRGEPPSGFVVLDGSTKSRTTYVLLYELWGTAFNTGGEAGTDFRLPDFRGRVPVGKGTHADVDVLGDNDGTTLNSRRPKHSHTVTESAHTHTNTAHSHTAPQATAVGGGTNAFLPGITPSGTLTTNTASVTINSASTGLTVGLATAPVDGPSYIVVNFIARYLISATPQPVGYLEQPLVQVTTTPPASNSDL